MRREADERCRLASVATDARPASLIAAIKAAPTRFRLPTIAVNPLSTRQPVPITVAAC